MHIQKTERSI